MKKSEKPKKTKKKLNCNAKSIALYTASVLYVAYSIFVAFDTTKYIQELISYGSLNLETQMVELINHYISTLSPYIFNAIVLCSLGYIIQKMQKNSDIKNQTTTDIKENSILEKSAE